MSELAQVIADALGNQPGLDQLTNAWGALPKAKQEIVATALQAAFVAQEAPTTATANVNSLVEGLRIIQAEQTPYIPENKLHWMQAFISEDRRQITICFAADVETPSTNTETESVTLTWKDVKQGNSKELHTLHHPTAHTAFIFEHTIMFEEPLADNVNDVEVSVNARGTTGMIANGIAMQTLTLDPISQISEVRAKYPQFAEISAGVVATASRL
ncbi:MAG: hypothetical protein H6774_00200 [Pseudomonadales bacterium]|nr:hypothetical protein [Candidatus Woesebacteria bacterium]MCB9801495.1 hypothetical protein [Pseudomonadales bacterium]